MSEIKEDMRIRKTRRDLRASLISLLKEKAFDNITVMDICDRAMVNRVTFYRYYEDKIHLLDDTIKSFVDIILELVPYENVNSVEEFIDYSVKIFSMTLLQCQSNIDLINALAEQKNVIVLNLIQTIIHSFMIDYIKAIDKIHSLKFPIEIVSHFVEGGFTQSIYYWLYHQESYPKEELIIGFRTILTSIATAKLLTK